MVLLSAPQAPTATFARIALLVGDA